VNRTITTLTAVIASALTLGVVAPAMSASALPATGSGSGATTACKGNNVKPAIHADAVKREGTLGDLVAKLQARKDPFGLNGPQISTLQSANSAIGALDSQIASTCYASLAALKADASKIWIDYRVYWLRVPQSHVIEASDWLSDARTHLGAAATKLAPLVGSNATAQADLAAMNQALSDADAKLGVAPNAGPNVAASAALAPAPDMTHDTAVLNAAHADLLTVRSDLVTARADGLKVVADLQK